MAAGLSSLATLLQPQVIVAGLLTGVVGGTVGVATGAIPVSDPVSHDQVLYACPDGGRVVTSVPPDARVLVVARSADGKWLELYVGTPRVEYGWAPVGALHLAAAPDSLPVAECAANQPLPTLGPPTSIPSAGEPTGQPSGSLGPTPPPTPLPTASASAGPTATPKPTKTPKPTPTPPNGPMLSGLNIMDAPENPAGSGTYPIYPLGCLAPHYAGVDILAVDPDGIGSMTLHWQPTGGAADSYPMGEEGPGEYYTAIVVADGWSLGDVTYWIEAVDTLGHTTTLYGDSQHKVVLEACPP